MAYVKHSFVNGQWLYAKELNEMEDQIALNEQNASAATSGLSTEISRATRAEAQLTTDLQEHAAELEAFETDLVLAQANVPTSDKNRLWLDTSEQEEAVIPEIKDNVESTTDTWSSKKIADKFRAMQDEINALKAAQNAE